MTSTRTHTCIYTYMHMLIYTHTCTHTVRAAEEISNPLSHFHPLPFPHAHAHTLRHTITHSLSHSLDSSRSINLSSCLYFTFILILFPSHTVSASLFLSLKLSPSLNLSLLTHAHTLSFQSIIINIIITSSYLVRTTSRG